MRRFRQFFRHGVLATWILAGCGSVAPEAAAPGAPSEGPSGVAKSPVAASPAPEAPDPRMPDPTARPSVEPTGPEVQAPAAPAPPAIPRNTAVLHIGDSFVLAGFSQALRPRLKELGVRYEVRSEQSSFTVTWASKLERLIADTQPDLVIITLGANEVANTNPPSHAPAVRRIAKLAGARPCVWVSPPSWRKDTGILDVIRENSAPCRFFDSDLLVTAAIPRQSDKIHPTKEGGEVWAAAFWAWLHAERAPAGSGRGPWALRAAPADEHRPRALLAQDDADE